MHLAVHSGELSVCEVAGLRGVQVVASPVVNVARGLGAMAPREVVTTRATLTRAKAKPPGTPRALPGVPLDLGEALSIFVLDV